jgi:hypothetical protein
VILAKQSNASAHSIGRKKPFLQHEFHRAGEVLDRVHLQEVLQFFWNRKRVYCFPEEGSWVEGDGDGTGAKASNCEGGGIRVNPGAAKVFDVVDGQRSLVDGKGEDDERFGLVAKVAEAGDGIESGIVDDEGKGADAFGRFLDFLKSGWFFDGRGPGYVGCDIHGSASCKGNVNC